MESLVDQGGAAELLKQRLGGSVSARLAEQLQRRTDSDLTLLAEVLDQVDPSADGLHRVPLRWPAVYLEPILAELAALDAQAREVIDVAAVIGREFDLAVVERICSSHLDVLSGLEQASHLVRQLPGHVFSFKRALVREVCYDELGARRRAELHEKVAGVLTALGATSGARAATVVELALHLGEAAALGGGQRLDAAAAAAATAGATAASEGALDMAAEYFAQAATLAGRAGWAPSQAGRLMVAAGSARLRAARTYEETKVGRAALAGALRMGHRSEDQGLIAAAALGFGPRPTVGGGATLAPSDQERREALEAGLGRPAELDASVAARLTARLALETGRAELAVAASSLAHDSGDPRALAEAGLAVAQLTGDEVSLRHAEQEASALGDQELLARVFDLQGALERLAAMEIGSVSAFVRWYVLRARAQLAIGESADAAAVARSEALAAGQVIDPEAARLADEVIQGARAAPKASLRSLSALTAREREVFELALRGAPSREIAETLVLGERTVETHLANIYRKLGVNTRVELIMKFR